MAISEQQRIEALAELAEMRAGEAALSGRIDQALADLARIRARVEAPIMEDPTDAEAVA